MFFMINPITTSLVSTLIRAAAPVIADSAMRRFLPVLGPTPRRLIVASLIVLGAVQLPLAATLAMLAVYTVYKVLQRKVLEVSKRRKMLEMAKQRKMLEVSKPFDAREEDRWNQFLDKLKGASEYPRISGRVEDVRQKALVNPAFRNLLFINIDEALRGCSDRSMHYFNLIFIDYEVCEPGISDAEVAKRLLGIKRAQILENLVFDWCKANLCSAESVERGLYCHIKLADTLGLPVPMTQMRYKVLGEVSEATLTEFADKVFGLTDTPEKQANYLIQEERWLDRLKMNHNDAFEAIDDAAVTKLNGLSDSDIGSGPYDLAAKKIQEERNAAIQALALRLTLAHLEKWPI